MIAATRGLDSTCTVPWVSRKDSSAAKLLVWTARPNIEPAAFAAFDSEKPVLADRPVAGSVITAGWPPPKGSGVSDAPGPMMPPETRLSWLLRIEANEAQFTPLW